MLTSMLAEGGHVVFCDEISVKYHTTFHQVHVSEATLRRTLQRFFHEVARVDDAGPSCPFTSTVTEKHDTPDRIASAPIR